MAKFRFTNSKKRKAAIAALCAVAVTCTSLAAACRTEEESSTDEETTRAEDTSTLTNGSFEFFNVPDDGVYLIKNVQDWSRSGDSSGTMSGIISTAEKDWNLISDRSLADTLNTNNDLLTSDDKYVDYNGMKAGDIPYREPYAAKLESSAVKDDKIINKNDLTYAEFLGITETGNGYTYGDKTVYFDEETGDFYFDYDEETEEYSNPVRYEVIKNPETHYGKYSEKDGKHYLGDHEIYVDEDGNYYKDEDHEYSEGNVLMIHNYPTDTKYNGIQQYYSSTTVTLEARTAAKISVWVKTSDLKFDKGYSLLDEQDRGAFIEVVQTVGGTTIDTFTIKAINTEKILNDNSDLDTNNGWLQYNIFVNACDFASCTVQVRLGLGKPNGETCTGYAFFDDVTLDKKLELDEDLGYTSKVKQDIQDHGTLCNLSSTDDDKIFYADKTVKGNSDERHSTHFDYLIDLASESGKEGDDGYKALDLKDIVNAGLTTEKEDKTYYASASKYEGKAHGVTVNRETEYKQYDKTVARPTDKDFLGLFTKDDSFDSYVLDDYASHLNETLFGDKSFELLPTYDELHSKMLVMFSAWGAAYTSTITSDEFSLAAGEQMIVSFWVKTADMDGKTPATLYIYDTEDPDKENANVQQLNINTTGVTTDFEDEKDIYNGWVQCFFFVQNNTKDEGNKTFQIDFCFGNTSIISASSYDSGWVALANMQTLKVTEKVYNITATANYTKKFQFNTDDDEKDHNKFADALGTYDISEEIALPDGYNGANGASSSVSNADYNQNFDVWNTNHQAGLINSDNPFKNEEAFDWYDVLDSFVKSAEKWDNVFGKDCYQPLIIVNNLREYADKARADEDTYKNYYLLVEDGQEEEYQNVIEFAGQKYRAVQENEPFDPEATYYNLQQVVNYGFVGANKTISSGKTEVITVKVMVTGNATAYIYLVDTSTREVMGYSIPGYTFWYDDEGNVLDQEFDEELKNDTKKREKHTVYEKQDNGLYKKDGKYFANLHNLKKIYYKKTDAHYWYDNGNGGRTEFKGKKLEEGVTYYADETSDLPSPHRLCNSNDQPIYEFKGENDEGVYEYYYIVSGKVSKTVVTAFDTQYARYNYDQNSEDGESLADTKYFVEVPNTGVDESGKPRWVTVNFVVRAGNNSKSYRLELWSGKRDEKGASEDLSDKQYKEGAVAFDYSAYPVSNFDTVLRNDDHSYEKTIIRAYQDLLKGNAEAAEEFKVDATIKDYEELAEKYLVGTSSEDAYKKLKESYIAHYYAYSLYDCEEFIPYNAEVAEDGETDYKYTAPESESLAFFRNTTVQKSADGKEVITSYNIFIDYSAVEQTLDKENAPSGGSSDDDGDSNARSGEFWLQFASILLVVVLLFVLLALVARIIIKKIIRKKKLKSQSKNVYRKRKRYLRKLHIEEEETEEIDNPALQNAEEAETPAEEDDAEVTEAPAEETPAEAPVETTEAPVEETPAEEAPAEEAPAETTETPSENSEDKPE